MKKLMICLGALALMAMPTGVEAQVNTNVNNTIGVSATVGKAFRWTLGQDLLFGTIEADLDGTTANVTVATDLRTMVDGRQAGFVTLAYNAETNVTVAAPTSLDGLLGGTLNVSFPCGASVSGTNTMTVQAAGACADADVLNLTIGAGSGTQKVDIYFGGTILGTDVEAAAADTYSSTITLTAAQP